MEFDDFYAFHKPALVGDEIGNNLLITLLERGKSVPDVIQSFWSLEKPGAFAIQQKGYGIALGVLNHEEIVQIVDQVKLYDFPSVIGNGSTAQWFVDEALQYDLKFPILFRESILALNEKPAQPNTLGVCSVAETKDLDMVFDWVVKFHKEALDWRGRRPEKEIIAGGIEKKRFFILWQDGKPVSLAAVGRIMENSACIAPVYTRPEERCKGYGGAVTQGVVEQIYKRGFKSVFLYVDDDNPASNRCYEKIGFQHHCRSLHFFKRKPAAT